MPASDLHRKSVDELVGLQRQGELTALALVDHFLARIEARNPELRALIAVNPDARSIAASLDKARTERGPVGPLHGIPIVIKDNIETRDPMATTAGSLALVGNLTRRDAPLVANLRAAGAVVLGKTNLSEWANFRSAHSSSGWSAVGGQTRNPHDVSRSPCGSSSGSAVAVAAGLAAAAVGTETDGSIVCPAAVNGVVGIKPTVGHVRPDHIVPISHSQDTAGPLAASVADAALLLAVMAGSALEAPLPELNHPKRRIGVIRSLTGYHPGVDACFDEALARLAAAGAELVDGLALAEPEGFARARFDILLYEFKTNLNRYLASLPGSASSLTLAKLIAFNRAHADRELVHFGQDLFERAEAMGPLSDATYREALALAQRAVRQDGIDALLSAHGLDALVAPTGPPAWVIDWVNGDHYLGGSTTPAAVAGYPHVAVPMGRVQGLPVGLSIFGASASEPLLIEIARSFEAVAGSPRRAPPAP